MFPTSRNDGETWGIHGGAVGKEEIPLGMTGVMRMIDLDSMAVGMPAVEGHPNRMDFRGVLTLVDVPSRRAPSGSGGKRVILTRAAAEAAVPSLIGMALDYKASFDGHDARRKVGVITSADVAGRNLEVGGYLYAKDFPEVVEEVAHFGRKPAIRAQGLTSERAGLRLAAVGLRSVLSDARSLRISLSAAVKGLREMIDASRASKREESEQVVKASGGELGLSFEVTNVDVVDRSARIWTLKSVTFTGAAILRKDAAAYRDTWIELV